MNKILLIDKEEGYTSRDVVNIICKNYHTKKVGHTGTLDPLATGVLVICIGKYTKLVDLITSYDKTYITKVVLGIKTNTLDITGNTIEETNYILNKDKLLETLNNFVGTYNQEVPIYSAVKVNGKKLYEYAREGIEVLLPKKDITVNYIKLLDISTYDNKPCFTIETSVSKGTYIRSLISDIASSLGTIGTMVSLRRTTQGNFNIEDCNKLNDSNNYKELTLKDILPNIKTITVDNNTKQEILNGKILDNKFNELVLFVDETKKELAIYKVYDKDTTKIKPYIMLYEDNK